jgi:hypothetical protein
MNRQETILSIRESLKKLFSATEEKKFSDFVLTDGSKITTAGDLEIGAEVYAVDEMGNQTPLDNGDYVLNDGRTITVMDNKLTNISGEESTEDESPVSDASMDTTSGQEPKDAPKMEKMTDGMADAPSDESDLAQRVSDLEAHLEEILNLLKQMSEAQTSSTQQMMSKIKTFAEEPGDVAIKSTKKGYEEYNSKKINQKKNMVEIEELRALMADRHKRDNNMAL